MNHEFLLSIVVPTRNRNMYALKTAEQILSFKNADLQLVIQDNSDENELENMLSHLSSDNRLKYNYCTEVLSFVDNFNLAVSYADGEYICIIGDDDGINPEIMDIARWASDHGIMAIKPEVQAVYFWPNSIRANDADNESLGYLTVSKISENVKIVDTSLEIKRLLQKGCQRYLSFNLVKLYHGLVNKDCLNTVKDLTGRYFGGLSPDIYSALALSIIVPKVICIDYPITISGICNKSGSADSATGKHTGDLKDAPHLVGHTNYVWSDLVPPFYSVETIWADSAIAAINDLGKSSMLKDFNLEFLAVYCFRKYEKYQDIITKHFLGRDNGDKVKIEVNHFKLKIAMLYLPITDFASRGFARLKKGRKEIVKYSDINDISDAQKVLEEHLRNKGLNISSVIDKMALSLDSDR